MKVTGKPISLIEVSRKKNARPDQPAADSKAPSRPASVVRHPGLHSLVQSVRDSREDSGSEKVERLRQAIAQGRYQASSADIASAMIRETMSFHGIEQ